MKMWLKVIEVVLILIFILGVVFFFIDYNRVKSQEKPIFCIQNPAGAILDGGTIEYFGLGYKVIDFNTLSGYDDIKIGTWFMDYSDFEEEIKEYEIKYEEELRKDNDNKENNINNKVTTINIQTSALSSEIPMNKIYFKSRINICNF